MEHSFIESANDPEGPFPLNNLPYGVCELPRSGTTAHVVVVAIGDHVLNLSALAKYVPSVYDSGDDRLLGSVEAEQLFATGTLNDFLKKGRQVWTELRRKLIDALRKSPMLNDDLRQYITSCDDAAKQELLPKLSDVSMIMPINVGDYTDFYSSKAHATNVSTIFRGANSSLPASWLHMPIAYHGRASSVVVSGTNIHRPCGQLKMMASAADDEDGVVCAPCQKMDFELEMGVVIGGPGNNLGDPISITNAKDCVFGFTLLNDWSARDIQKWEYVPLGPFTAKNFATTISPFIVTIEALQPFRVPLLYPQVTPTPPSYLLPPASADGDNVNGDVDDGLHCAFDVDLQVSLCPRDDQTPSVISKSNLKYLYWSVAQQVAHHTVTGCNLRAGDLLGSGTISGEEPEALGCMLELSWNGSRPVKLENNPKGDTRSFLEDGDIVTLTGMARGDGYCIGFGQCTGQLLEPKTSV